jgi:prepilin-type N-terminal cleavage/methylation domain-containing protein
MNAARSHRRPGLTLVELLVVIAIVGLLVALLLPAVQSARESARRSSCANNLKQLSLGLLSFTASQGTFPIGAVTATGSTAGVAVWSEAGNAASGNHGHSWIVQILPHVEQAPLFGQWDFTRSVVANATVARRDVPLFLCPTRRNGIRTQDLPRMFQGWNAGGCDYGGCVGSGNHFNDNGSNPSPPYEHELSQLSQPFRGILTINRAVAPAAIRDGMSNTLLIAEVQRLWQNPSALTLGAGSSQDGWAVGGAATLFGTDCFCGGPQGTEEKARSNPGGVNSGMFESPGSDHPGGAGVALADGSVQFVSDMVDPAAFKRLGSMASGEVGGLP